LREEGAPKRGEKKEAEDDYYRAESKSRTRVAGIKMLRRGAEKEEAIRGTNRKQGGAKHIP